MSLRVGIEYHKYLSLSLSLSLYIYIYIYIYICMYIWFSTQIIFKNIRIKKNIFSRNQLIL